MLIEDEFKAIYVYYKIKEIILFLEKPIPNEKEKIIVILKNSLKKDWGHNTISISWVVFAKKHHTALYTTFCKHNDKKNTAFFAVWMKIMLSFQKYYNIFLSTKLFSKYKTFCGTPFEGLIKRVVVTYFDLSVLGLLIREKANLGSAQVEKNTDRFSFRINLRPEYNQAFEKLIFPFLRPLTIRFLT